MKKREGVLENCQIQLHHNPETAQDLFKHLQPQTIQLPPLENGEILIKVLYIALDPSLKPLLAGEKNSSDSPHSNDMVYDHPHSESTHLDEKGSKLDPPRIDITTNQSTENTHFANYFPPPFSKQQEWIESNHPSISINSSTDPRRILNYGVLKAYAVGEVIESKNHLFTKGRNVYGNLGVQQYLLSNGGKDLDDNIVRDITLDSPLSAFLTLSKAGLCAYFGVTELTNVSEGECVFVSGGTGCVGSFVPQVVRAYLSDKKIREGIKKEEHHDHNMSTHKNSPSSSNNNHTHNGEKTALCSSSHCLVPHRSCNKAKSPTLSWLFNSLIEEENEEEYDLSHSNNEDEEHFPKSSHEVISREDEPSEPTHFVQHDPIVTPHGQIYYSPEEMKHGHHHHLPHHHHPHFHNAERLNMMNSAVATHKNPPQIKIFGFCSSESRKTLMTSKLKYDNAINYSNYMLKKNTNSSESGGVDESSPLLNSPVCASCLTPAWSSVSPFTHVYGANTSTQSTSDNSICGVLRDQPADTCLLKTGQRYDYSNIDRDALSKAIGEMCPDGIDVVFDTVGGVLLDLCLEHLKMNARIVICGAITNNSSTTSLANNNRETFKFEGPHNYVNLILKCARMEGFMVEKFQTKFKQASHTLVRWIQEKKIDSLEENVLECDLKDRSQVINAIEKLFSGEYYGKLIIRVKQNTTI